MAADTHSPAFYGSLMHDTHVHSRYSGDVAGYPSEAHKNSYASMVIDDDREAARMNGFQPSLGFLELSKVTHGLSIFGADTGVQIQSRVGAAAMDLGQREKQMQGILDIYIHHAIGMQNICMYKNQDVYAKFSLTHSDAEALRTKVVNAGGRSPVFNEGLQIAVNHPDPVLKCELWMASENQRYLEDQMLAFALVPLASLEGRGKYVHDHELVSTDLFHSPYGVVRLALNFHERTPSPTTYADAPNKKLNPAAYNRSLSSLSSYPNMNRDILDSDANLGHFNLGSLTSLSRPVPTSLGMDATIPHGETLSTMVGSDGRNVFQKFEFADMQLSCENQQLVSDYLKLTSTDLTLVCPSEGDCYGKQAGVGDERMVSYPPQSSFMRGPFLQLGSFPVSGAGFDMVVNSGEGELKKADCSVRYDSSGLQPMDECRIFSAAGASPFDSLSGGDAASFAAVHSESAYSSPSSCIVNEARSSSVSGNSSQGSPSPGCSSFFTSSLSRGSSGDSATVIDSSIPGEQSHNNLSRQPIQSRSPLGLLEEREVVQQDIVDLYTKSFQQFTESLAKMQIPVVPAKDVAPGWRDQQESMDTRKRLPTRVFYGSRAFF